MTRTCSSLAVALVAASTLAAQAQPVQTPATRAANLRHQIYLMEGALARAVNFGAATLNQEIRAVMPDMLVLAGESNARGFHLDGYGVFFDVEVPVLRQSMMWSLRTMLDQDSRAPPTRSRRCGASCHLEWPGARGGGGGAAAARSAGSVRSACCAAGRRPGHAGGRRRRTRRRRTDPARPAAAGQSAAAQRPEQGLHRCRRQALIDAMVDYSLPMVSSMQPGEVPDGGRPRQRAARPAGPAQSLRRGVDLHAAHHGSDLADYRTGKIDRDEARKRVQVQEF